MAYSLAKDLMLLAKRTILDNGEPLVFTRRAVTANAGTTEQTIWCLPQPVNFGSGAGSAGNGHIGVEGALNVAEDTPFNFICPGDSDVKEGIDYIAHNGWTWRVDTVQAQRMGAINIMLNCIATREVGF